MHDGNLAGRAAKADEAELQPEQEGLPEADLNGRVVGRFGFFCQGLIHYFWPFSKEASSPSKMLLANARSWSSLRMVSRRPAKAPSIPAASGG